MFAQTDRPKASPPCKPGDRIELTLMGADPHSGKPDPCPIPPGTRGTVTFVTALHRGDWQIGVVWDAPRSLMLIWPTDRFRIINPTLKPQENDQ